MAAGVSLSRRGPHLLGASQDILSSRSWPSFGTPPPPASPLKKTGASPAISAHFFLKKRRIFFEERIKNGLFNGIFFWPSKKRPVQNSTSQNLLKMPFGALFFGAKICQECKKMGQGPEEKFVYWGGSWMWGGPDHRLQCRKGGGTLLDPIHPAYVQP